MNADGLVVVELFDFIRLDNDLGIGQVTSLSDKHAEVTYFHSVTQPRIKSITAPLRTLRPIPLPDRQLCYRRADGCWWVGRVHDRQGRKYLVRFTGGSEQWIEGSDLRVRWSGGYLDPIDDLIGGNWSSHPGGLEDTRRFLEWCAKQRRELLGFASFGSLIAEVHDHQIEVARRVMSDPVGRFLLADEVGLGKTVEALYVIRQFLIDDPGSRIRVVVPPEFVSQWQGELEYRTFISENANTCDYPRAFVEVVGMNSPDAWHSDVELDLLVIDEAHRVASWAHARSADAQVAFEAARELTDHASCVLLISATPSLHRSETFLALLHLLDPQRHDLRDLANFEKARARRDQVATALLTVDPEDPFELVVDALDGLTAVIPEDAELRGEIAEFVAQVQRAGDLSQTDRSRVGALSLKVAENFRFDRRMLRNRRQSVQRRFPVRGRILGPPHLVQSPSFETGNEWFGRWREALLLDHSTADQVGDVMGELVGLFADRAMGAPGLLAPLSRARLGCASATDLRMLGLSISEEDALLSPHVPVGSVEAEELAHVPTAASAVPNDYLDSLVEYLWDQPASIRTVVMTSFTQVAVDLGEALLSRFQPSHFAQHLTTVDQADNKTSVTRFVDPHDYCRLLICDRSGEEGLNLQCTDVMVLLDLPLAADRLEQRIGRADRYAHQKPVEVRLIALGGRVDTRTTWEHLLSEGFHIFERSIASLHVKVGEMLPTLRERLGHDGPQGLADSRDWVTAELEAAVRELSRADLLDGITIDEAGNEITVAIGATDGKAAEDSASLDRVACKQLLLPRWHHGEDTDIVSFWLTNPRIGIEPDVDQSARREYFSAVVSAGAKTRRSTYDRMTAVERRGARLLRVGDGFVDAIETYLRDRPEDGRVSAIWRRTPRPPNGTSMVGFALCFWTNVDLPPESASLSPRDIAALRRRVNSVIPPASSRVLVSSDGAVLDEDDDLGLLLSFEYSPTKGDTRLWPSAFDLVNRLVADRWEDSCERAVGVGRTKALAELGLDDPIRLAAKARRLVDARVAILEAREAPQFALEREDMLSQFLEIAIESADVLLGSAHVIVVTDEKPSPSARSPSKATGA